MLLPSNQRAHVNNKRLQFWFRLCQIAVTASLMIWLLRQSDWSITLPMLSRAHWSWVALSVGCLLINHLINIVRWQYLLEYRVRFRLLLPLYGAGLFSNNFLPTGVGGDGVRAILLSRYIPLAQAISSVALDRGIGLISLGALWGIGIWVGMPPGIIFGLEKLTILSRPTDAIMVVFLVIAVIITFVVAWQVFPTTRGRISQLLRPYLAIGKLPRRSFWHWMRQLAGGYIISICSNFCIVVAIWCVLESLHVDILGSAALWVMVLSSLSLLLPISVNGIGVVEGVYVAVLACYGIAPSISVAAALMMRAISLLISLVGGLALLDRSAPNVGRDAGQVPAKYS
jgi:glycosyltransferase 2 family protein